MLYVTVIFLIVEEQHKWKQHCGFQRIRPILFISIKTQHQKNATEKSFPIWLLTSKHFSLCPSSLKPWEEWGRESQLLCSSQGEIKHHSTPGTVALVCQTTVETATDSAGKKHLAPRSAFDSWNSHISLIPPREWAGRDKCGGWKQLPFEYHAPVYSWSGPACFQTFLRRPNETSQSCKATAKEMMKKK